MTLTDEQLAAMRDGCEGATPGPWKMRQVKGYRDDYVFTEHCDYLPTPDDMHRNHVASLDCGKESENAAHIANCDPDTIRVLASELLERRAAEAGRQATGDDLQRRLREAATCGFNAICIEAADALAAKDAEIERLRTTLAAATQTADAEFVAKLRLRDTLQAEIERLTRERDEARAYLKAFVYATIDPDDKRADAQLHKANPSMGWLFFHDDTKAGGRQILSSQVRRAMEIVGYDRLKIEAHGTTVADDLVEANRARRVAEAQRDEALATVARLREALGPFAKAAEVKLCGEFADSDFFHRTDIGAHLVFGDIRRARAALEGEP